MFRLTLILTLGLVACGGGSSDDTDAPSVIGDGTTPVVRSAEYACFTDANGGTYFYFRIEAEDEQGSDTIPVDGAKVLFIQGGTPLDWDADGSPDDETWLDLNCAAETDPRRCEGSLLEGDVSGPCADTNLTFEGWVVDQDGNESEHVTGFELNGAIAPAG